MVSMGTLFAYGTLQHPRIITHVLGRVPESRPVLLPGFARYRVDGYRFPGIVPDPRAETDGTLFLNIRTDEWQRLDEYEADFYERWTVETVSPEGVTCRAQAYVVPPHHQHALTTDSWDLKTYKPGPDSGIT